VLYRRCVIACIFTGRDAAAADSACRLSFVALIALSL
jgi:hypothetical protein